MPQTITNSTFLAVSLALGLSLPAAAQKYTPEPPPLTTAPCKPTKKSPCATPASTPAAVPAPANPFPFPGEEPQATPATTATPAGQSAFPFPGESGAEQPTPASSSSSSSSADAAPDPDQPALKDEGSTGSTRFARKKPKVAAVNPEDREAEDIQVSRYYFSTGNFEAAYLRAKDATTIIPDDPAAHLALAEAAARVNKPDEAAAAYSTVLKLDSSDQQVKAAKKALAEIASAKPVKQAAK